MGTKIPAAQQRMFANVFVCKSCGRKVRTQAVRIIAGKIKCQKCNSHAFKPKRKK